MEINMQTKTIHQQVQSSTQTFGERDYNTVFLCVGSQEKQQKRTELIMFSIEPLEHFRRSWPSSRTGTLMFHEFSGKTSGFPSIQRDDYTDPEKGNFLLEHKTCPTVGPSHSFPFLLFQNEAWGIGSRAHCSDHEPARTKGTMPVITVLEE